MSLIIPILTEAAKESKDEEYSGKKKTSFWASETETMPFETYHRWKGTPPTNPITGEKIVMLSMRKLTEEAIVNYLRKSKRIKVIEKFTNQERCYFEWGPNKVPISGYTDVGVDANGEPIIIEVKTYYGNHQHSQIRIGMIRESYAKQLCIYQYYHKVPRGILLMANQGTGEMFEYDFFQQENPYHFICQDNAMEINLEETFKKFEKTYINFIKPDKEPPIDKIYKYPIEEIDWENTSKSMITKARNNKAVIGDWEVKWSDYKDMIIERQGTVPGYTQEELDRIIELTAGYSRRKATKVRFNPDDL